MEEREPEHNKTQITFGHSEKRSEEVKEKSVKSVKSVKKKKKASSKSSDIFSDDDKSESTIP